jgi:hypothetical protein
MPGAPGSLSSRPDPEPIGLGVTPTVGEARASDGGWWWLATLAACARAGDDG